MVARGLVLPASFDGRASMGPVLDQGGLGSCMLNAFQDAIRTWAQRQTGHAVQLGSRLWPYWFVRWVYDEVTIDSGSDGQTIVETFRNMGNVEEAHWQYDDTCSGGYNSDAPDPFQREPSSLSMELALPQRGKLVAERLDNVGEAYL
jgi:hypothetical protein